MGVAFGWEQAVGFGQTLETLECQGKELKKPPGRRVVLESLLWEQSRQDLI